MTVTSHTYIPGPNPLCQTSLRTDSGIKLQEQHGVSSFEWVNLTTGLESRIGNSVSGADS